VPAPTQLARGSEHTSTATIPQDEQRAEQLTLCYSLGILHDVRLPVMCSSVLAFPSPVTFSEPTRKLPRPDEIGFWGGGGAVGLRSTREHTCTLFSGARRSPGSGADCEDEILRAGVVGLLESMGRPRM